MEEDIRYLADIGIDDTLDAGGSILPAQWAAGPAVWTAEQRLYAELLADAMRALIWGAGVRESSKRWTQAIAWVEGMQTTVSFAECCCALAYDPSAARAAIYRRVQEYRALNLARRPQLPRPRRRPARPAAKSPARKPAITPKIESTQLALLPPCPGPPRAPRVRRPRPAPVVQPTQLSFDWFHKPAAQLAA